jgi:hypothetical protein
MNEIQLREKSLEDVFESQAPLELRALLAQSKDEPKVPSEVKPERAVPRFFGRYFQTLPIGMN